MLSVADSPLTSLMGQSLRCLEPQTHLYGKVYWILTYKVWCTVSTQKYLMVFKPQILVISYPSWLPLSSSMAWFFWLSHYFLSHPLFPYSLLSTSFSDISLFQGTALPHICTLLFLITFSLLILWSLSILFCTLFPFSLPWWFLLQNHRLQSDLYMAFNLPFQSLNGL